MSFQKQEYKKILISPDKFKGSLTSAQAAQAIKGGIEQHYAALCNCGTPQFRIIEIADGGDGSLEVLKGKIPSSAEVAFMAHDPLGREVSPSLLLYEKDGQRCAFIEMARVCGLEMLTRGERNPLQTSTYGLGEAIKFALEQGVARVTLSIGGSATNDGGAGMLQALGYRFFRESSQQITTPVSGGDLQSVVYIEPPQLSPDGGDILSGVELKVICDVTNPLLGPQGATAVYAPQKGADERALELLEAGMANYAAVAESSLGIESSFKWFQGAGAAGGVGYASLAFLGAELIPGWRFFAETTSLEESVEWADLVITGEGSLDLQSLSGKVVSGVLNMAAQYNKPVKIFCGVNKLTSGDIENLNREVPAGVECFQITSFGYPVDVCMRDAAPLLQQLACENI